MSTYYLESIFNPSEQNENIIAEYIDRATQSIEICMYVFTSKFLAMKLLEKSQQRVKIRILADQTEAYKTYSVVGALKETSDWGIQIRLVKKAMLHNKFMIVDNLYLLIGSMNFSFKSKHNYENGSFFYGQISSDYTKFFNNLFYMNSHVYINLTDEVKRQTIKFAYYVYDEQIRQQKYLLPNSFVNKQKYII